MLQAAEPTRPIKGGEHVLKKYPNVDGVVALTIGATM